VRVDVTDVGARLLGLPGFVAVMSREYGGELEVVVETIETTTGLSCVSPSPYPTESTKGWADPSASHLPRRESPVGGTTARPARPARPRDRTTARRSSTVPRSR